VLDESADEAEESKRYEGEAEESNAVEGAAGAEEFGFEECFAGFGESEAEADE
jgi:hypothetical protein